MLFFCKFNLVSLKMQIYFLVLLYEVKNINSNSKKIVKKQEEIFGRMNINY